MTLEEFARGAGKAIAGSEEFRALVAAEKAYAADKEAQELVRVAQVDGERLTKLKAAGKAFSAEDQKRIVEAQARISANPVIGNLIKAQQAYDALVQRVNGWVQAEVQEERKKA